MKAKNSLKRWLSSALLVGASTAAICRADTVYLTNGSEINGTIVNEDAQTVVIKTTRGVTRSIRRSEIDTVVHEKAAVVKKEEPKVPTAPPLTATGAKPMASDKTLPAETKSPGKATTAPAPQETASVQPATVPPPRLPSSLPPPRGDASASGATPIPNFPENSKRMSKRKETLFADALETIKVAYKNPEDKTREPAMSDIRALGSDVMPYLWAGVQNDDMEVRTACMAMIGQMNGRTCIKRVIETFFMTMPEASAAATWNVPFVDETIKTAASITGQSFVTVEARRLGVQDGLKKYISWYKENFKSLPKQIGEPDLDATDPEYDGKLLKLRELKLTKREWPSAGSLPVENISGPNRNGPERPQPAIIKDAEREVDKKFGASVPTVTEDQALKRPGEKPVAPEDVQALKRPIDPRNGLSNAAKRDPPSDKPAQNVDQPDPLLRPQDRLRQQQNQ